MPEILYTPRYEDDLVRIYKYSARKWGRSVDDVVMIAAGYSGRAWRRIMQRIEPQIQAFIDRIEAD